ncbi:MAG: transcriptional regulator [Gordonia sp. (in: high G+C Gram-positive bacteria)]|uniref:transcriptional regulator n=1 Tax=Gordonia sp. (in: high G+C Gram-positive bacteria) TaxID=84139 RepID=UPI0039E28D4A
MEKSPERRTRRHRPALIVLVLVAAVICLLMGWWQWDRYESASGTAQNLGYALQWPLFAVAFVWAYRRFVTMEADPEEARKAVRPSSGPTEIPAGLLPDRPTADDPTVAALSTADDDPELAEYNRYLAGLDKPTPDNAATTAKDTK